MINILKTNVQPQRSTKSSKGSADFFELFVLRCG